MRLWTNRRKSRDDEKPGHGSDRRGSYRIPSATLACNPPGGSKQANLTNRHTGRPSSRRGIYCFGPGGQMIILASFAWLMWEDRDAAVRAICSIRVTDLLHRSGSRG